MSFNFNEYLTSDQIDLKNKILAEIKNDEAHIGLRPGQISTVPSHCSLDGFADLVKALIDLDQRTSDQRVTLLDNYSRTNVFEDPLNPLKELSGVVLYSVEHRSPGSMAGGNNWFSRERREVKPRVRSIVYNDNSCCPGQAKIIYSQWFDNEVRFDVCARTNKRANNLAAWFENLMESNRLYFGLHGANKFFFDRRERDEFVQLGNEGYERRPYFYRLRTEETYTLTEQTLNKVIMTLSV